MDNIPHLALPLRLSGGAYVTRQQDTDSEAADCVKAILSFRTGDRDEDPDFGILDPTFETQPIDVDDIERAINEYEPRVDFTVTTEDKVDGTTSVFVQITMPTSDDLTLES